MISGLFGSVQANAAAGSEAVRAVLREFEIHHLGGIAGGFLPAFLVVRGVEGRRRPLQVGQGLHGLDRHTVEPMPAHGALDGDISGQPVAVGLGQVVERRIAVAQNPFHAFVVGRPRELPGVGAEDVDGAGDDREPQQASVRAPAAPFAEQVQLIPRPQRIGVALQRALHAEVLLVVDHVAGIQSQKIVEELVGVHDAFVVAYPVRLEGIAGRGTRTDREAPHGVGLGGDHHVIGGSVEVDVFAARIGGGQQVVAFLDESPDHRGVVEQVPVRIMAVGHWVEEVGTPCEREGGGQDDQQFFMVSFG